MMGGTLSTMVYSVPAYLLYIAGLTYALLQWRRHPRLSAVLGAGLMVLLTRLLGTNLLGLAWRYGHAASAGWRLASIFLQLLFLLGQAMVIAAAFVGFAEGRKASAGTAPPAA